MEFCRDVLRTLAIALIIGLGFISVASAQSGNPIRIGMSLALTGAGASPSKVINTALEIWHDDFNALLLTGLPCPGMMTISDVSTAGFMSQLQECNMSHHEEAPCQALIQGGFRHIGHGRAAVGPSCGVIRIVP